jgi:hypothetical protein
MADLTGLFANIEYWRGLWSSDDFRGQTLANCVEVIHVDIVSVWNLPNKDRVCLFFSSGLSSFAEGYQYLSRKAFREEFLILFRI